MENPLITIIIPVFNEENYIAECLDSIITQSYPSDKIEVLVIDGISTDNTCEIVESYSQKYNNIRLLYNKKKIAPVAMNIGIKAAQGKVIIRIDGHSYVHKDFIKNSVEALEKNKDAWCVGGPIETINTSFVSKAISNGMSSPFGVGNALFRYSKKQCYVDTLAFGAYYKWVFDKIGYFDEQLVRNQDDELNYRLTKAGGKILLDPKIKSYYYSRASLKKLWKQYYQYGFWKVRVIQKHKKPASVRHVIPVTFVLSIIISAIGAVFNKYFLWLFILIILSYTALNLLFSVSYGIKNRSKESILLPVIFFILHFSYGLGFLNGIMSFYLFKGKKNLKINTDISR